MAQIQVPSNQNALALATRGASFVLAHSGTQSFHGHPGISTRFNPCKQRRGVVVNLLSHGLIETVGIDVALNPGIHVLQRKIPELAGQI